MRLPSVAGTLSDATMLSWTNLDQMVAQTIFQPVVNENFTTLGAWTKTDSGSNINVASNQVSFNGSNTLNANAIVLTSGITVAPGILQYSFSVPNIANCLDFNFSTTNTPSNRTNGTQIVTALNFAVFGLSLIVSNLIVAATTYTIKIYITKSLYDNTYRHLRFTISGGLWTTETTVYECDRLVNAFSGTVYPCFSRYINNASLTYLSAFSWYSGYATSGPYIEYVHDAGSGNVFVNFDPTSLALPGTVPSTNLKFAWSFDDGSASYSSYLTLAALNAVGKQTAQHRYIRLRVQLNSDGPTYVIGAKPNSDTATDGIGQFPSAANVLNTDHVQQVSGTATAPAAGNLASGVQCGAGGNGVTGSRTDCPAASALLGTSFGDPGAPIVGTFNEAARNISAGASNILQGVNETIQGNVISGTLVQTGGGSSGPKRSFKNY